MKLTASAVATLKLPAGKTDHIEWDADLRGFGFRLRLGRGGRVNCSWVAQYRYAGATRRALLGSAVVLGAEPARTAAKKFSPPSRSATIRKASAPTAAPRIA